MDIGAFVQENRRWLIGCVIGVIVFFIAQAVIGSVYNPATALSGLRAEMNKVPSEIYDRETRDLLIEESEALAAEKARLQNMLAFARGDRFLLPAGTDAGRFLFQAGRTLKQGILTDANERNVAVTDKEIAWPVPNGVDEIGRVLFGLELLHEASSRLFAAHDGVIGGDPDAIGLRAILSLRTESRQRTRGPMRTRNRSGVDLRDYVEQERLLFRFEADGATILSFLESCRQPGRTLVIENIKMEQPEQIGEPVVVTGSLTGIAFKEPPQ